MKKTVLILMLLLTLLSLFTACATPSETAQSSLSPLPPPAKPPYVPEPLNVEFFNTGYSNMSPWQAYPSKKAEVTEAPNFTTASTEENTPTEE